MTAMPSEIERAGLVESGSMASDSKPKRTGFFMGLVLLETVRAFQLLISLTQFGPFVNHTVFTDRTQFSDPYTHFHIKGT